MIYDRQEKPDWIGEILLPGDHNIENVLQPSASRAADIGEPAIKLAATTFKGVVHRLEFVRTIDGVSYINNSMCTKQRGVCSFSRRNPRTKVVLAGGVYKGGDNVDLVRAATRVSVKRLVLFGRSALEIEEAVRSTGFDRVDRVDNLEAAVLHFAKSRRQATL